MPSSMIYNFVPGDIIDLKNVTFDINGYTVLETSNNSVQPNNVLQVTENGIKYELSLDPSSNMSGGILISPDGAGGRDIKTTSGLVGRNIYANSTIPGSTW